MQRDLQGKLIEHQEQKRRHLQSYVDRFRYKASKAKQAQSRLKMLAKLQDIMPLENESNSHFSFPDPVYVSPPLLSMENVSVGYEPDKPILKKLTFKIPLAQRNGKGNLLMKVLLVSSHKIVQGNIIIISKLDCCP